jgi:hypothetical protein
VRQALQLGNSARMLAMKVRGNRQPDALGFSLEPAHIAHHAPCNRGAPHVNGHESIAVGKQKSIPMPAGKGNERREFGSHL